MAYTELQMAASYGDVALIQRLLARGVSVNACGFEGKWTPLHVAAGRGHLQVVDLLLGGRADFRAIDQDGRTALDWAQRSGLHAIAAKLRLLEDDLLQRPHMVSSILVDAGTCKDDLLQRPHMVSSVLVDAETCKPEPRSEDVNVLAGTLQRQISSLELDLEQSNSRFESLEVSAKHNQERLRSETEELEQGLVKKSAHMSSLETELLRARAEASETRGIAEQRGVELAARLTDRNDVSGMACEAIAWQTECESLTSKLATSASLNESFRKKNDSLEAEVHSSSQHLIAEATVISKLHAQLSAQAKEAGVAEETVISKLRAQLSAQTEEAEVHSSSQHSIAEETVISKLRAQLSAQTEEAATVQEELAEMKSAFAEAQDHAKDQAARAAAASRCFGR